MTSTTWMTLGEAATHLGVSTDTVRRRISDGTLLANRFDPRLIRVYAESVRAAGKPIDRRHAEGRVA